MDQPEAEGFLSLTAPRAEGCGLPFGNTYKVSVTDSPFCVIWHDRHSADWFAALASPFPAALDFSTGKRVTRFSGRFAPLRIVFPCHPYAGGRIKHLEASLRKRLYSKHGLLCHLEEGERWWRQPPKGDCISSPAGRLYGFIQTGAFYNLEAPYNNLRP